MAILAAMGYTPWGQPKDPATLRASTIAEQVDLTPETVRDRIGKLEDAGVIPAWEAYPNPRLIGLQVAGYAFHPPAEAVVDDALEEARLVDGVLEVLTYHGPFAAVALAYRDGAERDRRLSLLAGRFEDEDPAHVFEPPMPSVDRELDGLDWRIIGGLRGDARRSLRELADEIGASYRTVKRRFDRLTGDGSLYVVPRVDLSHVAGILAFTLVVRFTPEAGMDAVNRLSSLFQDRLLHRMLPREPAGALAALGLWTHTPAQMAEITRQAEALEGIERATAVLSKGRHTTGWIDGRIEQRAERTG